MSTRWHRSLALVALASTLLVGCGSADDDGSPVQQRDRASSPDAPDTGGHGDSGNASAPDDDVTALIEQALLARDAGNVATFSSLLGEAAQACAEPSTARRLDEVSLIAGRWAAALADGRPKVQATTEDQLADVDWSGLAAACVRA